MFGPLSGSSPPGMNLFADSMILQTPPFPLDTLEEVEPYSLLEWFVTGGVGSDEGEGAGATEPGGVDTGDVDAPELAGDTGDLEAPELEGLSGRIIRPKESNMFSSSKFSESSSM